MGSLFFAVALLRIWKRGEHFVQNVNVLQKLCLQCGWIADVCNVIVCAILSSF